MDVENSNNANLFLLIAAIAIGIVMWQWLIVVLYAVFVLSFAIIPIIFMLKANRALNKYNNK